MGAMTPPSRKSCYNFRVVEINRVVDGDTIDVTIDLGFDLSKKERVRVAGVDTPEKRTRNLEEKALGIDATNHLYMSIYNFSFNIFTNFFPSKDLFFCILVCYTILSHQFLQLLEFDRLLINQV